MTTVSMLQGVEHRSTLVRWAVRIALTCTDCDAEMDFMGVILPTAPPYYPHKCPKCGKTHDAREIYPRIEQKVDAQ